MECFHRFLNENKNILDTNIFVLYSRAEMNNRSHELGYKSLTQCVTDYLKEKLAKGELKPGE